MNVYRDPELDGLADERGWDPDLRELAQYLRATPHPYAEVEPSPQFRQALQRNLMREAWEQSTRPAPRWYSRLFAPQPLAAAAAAIGAVLIVFTAFFFAASPQQHDRINVAVTSPQQNAQLVSIVEPIQLQFSQPMDTSSVHVDIQPTTEYVQEWSGNTLKITPRNGLSPNTQYQVKVTAARTATQKPVADIKPVVFSTGPVPTPTPSVGPSPTPAPSPIFNIRQIVPVGSLHSVWLPDGSGVVVVGPGGSLQIVPLSAGAAATHVADGVTRFAVAADGTVVYLSNGQVTWGRTTVTGVQPLALGFRQGALLIVTAADVETADHRQVVALNEAPTAADFSPTGDSLAYLGSHGLHLVDLAAGKDTLVGPASDLGDWSPDNRHYAYLTDAGASVADARSNSSSKLADLPGVSGVSWSSGNQLLLATGTALYLANYTDGSPATTRQLSDNGSTFGQPEWAPNGSGQFTFRRNGALWLATVRGAASSSIPQPTPSLTQDDVVNAFMNARKNQASDQALQWLDPAGRDAFSRLTLIYSDPSQSLARFYVLLSQPGRVVVRLVMNRGLTQTAVDETLGIQADATGRLMIHSVSEMPRLQFGSGPEIVSVSVTSSQIQVVFDSDLDPASAVQPGSVIVSGVNPQASFDQGRRTITLAIPGGLTTGATYTLSVGTGLRDVSQRHAAGYDLSFLGP